MGALTAVALPVAAQDLESDQGKLGYAIGYEFGSETSQWDVDIEAVVTAIRDADAGREPHAEPGHVRPVHDRARVLVGRPQRDDRGVERRRPPPERAVAKGTIWGMTSHGLCP